MPKLSGHQVAKALRDVRPDLRVTYVSGYSDDPDIARQVAEHRASFIRKPYATDDLLRAIEGVLAKR